MKKPATFLMMPFILLASPVLAQTPVFAQTNALNAETIPIELAANYPPIPAEEKADAARLTNAIFNDNLFADTIGQSVKVYFIRDESLKDIVAQYPDMPDYVANFVRTKTQILLAPELPTIRDELGRLYASKMTAAQLKSTADFLASSSGRKLLRLGIDAGINDPNVKIEDVSVSEQMEAIDKSDLPAMQAFEKSGAADIFAAANIEMQALLEKWSSNMDSKYSDHFTKMGAEAYIQYFEHNVAKSKQAATSSGGV